MKKLTAFLRQADKMGDRYLLVLIIALAGLVLRIPSFFEPIWYGDEAIYLTIGHAMNNGAVLYKDIVDHKTPLIYYLARVDSQTYFRLMTGLGMVMVTVCFYIICQFWFKSKKLSYLATSAFMLLTTLPLLEGPMANGELWVLIFVIPALLILTRIESIRSYFEHDHKIVSAKDKKERWLLTSAGVLFGLALMTKVPALFDIAAGYMLVLLPFIGELIQVLKTKNWWRSSKKLMPLLKQYSWLTLGILIPFVISLIVFSLNNGLADYLKYGLLYNLHYAGTWRPDFGSALLAAWFSLPGKGLTLLLFIIGGLFLAKRQSGVAGFILAWFGLDLFASLLSNRPYPHYLLQLVPTFILLLLAVYQEGKFLLRPKAKLRNTNQLVLIFSGAGLFWLITSLVVIKFYFYPTAIYFTRFLDRITNKITYEQYAFSFNDTIKDNIAITNFLRQNQVTQLYIWGSNPLLYAQGKFIPATQLITLFHIDDLKAHPATLAQLQSDPPSYIVVMKNAALTYAPFATWLNLNYIPNHQFDQAVLWKHVTDPMILGSISRPKGQ